MVTKKHYISNKSSFKDIDRTVTGMVTPQEIKKLSFDAFNLILQTRCRLDNTDKLNLLLLYQNFKLQFKLWSSLRL